MATTDTTTDNLQCLQSIQEADSFNPDGFAAIHHAGARLEESETFTITSDVSEERQNEEIIIIKLKCENKTVMEHINEQNKDYEDKTQMYEKLLQERENDIFNLKHRINEEIEEKNNLKAYYSDEMSKLNNEINELEQKNKDNLDRSRQIIGAKMQDIEILQEQKLSLLQSLTNEITKLNNIITKLKSEITIEQQLKQNVKDWYEYKLMKLNEKVLNRNNELVELQDGIFGKGEAIENLQIELKRERERSKKLHDDLLCVEREKKQIENVFRIQTEEMLTMQRNYEKKIVTILNDTENTEPVYRKEGCDSKKQSGVDSRKRTPLQDASNFNYCIVTHSKENYNMQILSK